MQDPKQPQDKSHTSSYVNANKSKSDQVNIEESSSKEYSKIQEKSKSSDPKTDLKSPRVHDLYSPRSPRELVDRNESVLDSRFDPSILKSENEGALERMNQEDSVTQVQPQSRQPNHTHVSEEKSSVAESSMISVGFNMH